MKALRRYWGRETSDPVKVAQVILRLPDSESLPAHLLIGSDAVRFAAEAEATRAAEAERWREVSISTDAMARLHSPRSAFERAAGIRKTNDRCAA